MAPDLERLARTPWPMASLASSGIRLFSSVLAFSWPWRGFFSRLLGPFITFHCRSSSHVSDRVLIQFMRETGVVYTCPPWQHDDLGISCAMLAWAARHPHLDSWVSTAFFLRRPRRPRQKVSAIDGRSDDRMHLRLGQAARHDVLEVGGAGRAEYRTKTARPDLQMCPACQPPPIRDRKLNHNTLGTDRRHERVQFLGRVRRRKTKHRGLASVATDFMLNLIAYNLIRIPKLLAA